VISDNRYVANADKFKNFSYLALSSRFANREEFESFYSSLGDPAIKGEFLRAASFYLFLVKNGDWHTAVDGSNEIVGYMTNSLKLVALFSIVESLSDKQYKDFYSWLCKEVDVFPVKDKAALSELYGNYKNEYGSTLRCKTFFENLPQSRQDTLLRAITIDGKPFTSIEQVAGFLYDLRSKFVHEARFAHVGDGAVLSMKGNRLVQLDLSIDVLLESFEEGLLVYFRCKKHI
jgi:hypothetical protein